MAGTTLMPEPVPYAIEGPDEEHGDTHEFREAYPNGPVRSEVVSC